MIDYEGYPYLSFIDEKIQKEMNNRSAQDNRIRNINAWVKVTSGVQQIKGSTNRNEIPYNNGELYTLQSILTTQSSSIGYDFNSLYNEVDNRPEPGIISIDIKYTGDVGGVRVAQIKWQVNSLDQFQKYAPYFLNPGRTMLVEFGWTNQSSSIYELSRDEYDAMKFDKSLKAWEYLNERSLKSNGMYDGMLGMVTNYDFNLREDGGFDIMTEVTSQGNLMYGLNLVHQANVSGQGENKDVYQTTIKNFVRDELNDIATAWPAVSNTLINLLPGKKLAPDVDVYIDKKSESPNNRFITWGFIEDIIVNPWIGIRFGKQEDGTNGKPMFQLKSTDASNFYATGQDAGFRSVKISNHPRLRTTNLNVCFINNTLSSKDHNFLNFSEPADGASSDAESNTGYLRNIYVNLAYVYESFDLSDTLSDALLRILNEISSACIQFWDFNLKLSEKDQTLRVIDKNYSDQFLKQLIDGSKNTEDNIVKKIYLFRAYGGNGFIKTINFSSKLSNDVAMTSMYANNKEETDNYVMNSDSDAFRSIWGAGTYRDYFYETLYYKTKNRDDYLNPASKGKDDAKVNVLSLHDNDDNKEFKEAQQFLPTKEKNIDEINLMKEKVYGKSETEDQKSNLIIPADFEMTIEGISGLKIGDLFWIDAVPDMYLQDAVFQIVGITQAVQNNYWSTSIRAMLKVTNTGVSAKQIKSDTSRSGITTPKIKQTIQSLNTDGRDTSIIDAADKAETLALLKQVWQDKSIEGFKVSDKILSDAAIIINAESSFKPNNFNTTPPDYSLGLFQINLIKPGLYAERVQWSDLGVIKDKASVHPTTQKSLINHNLWDKKTNIKSAKRIFKQANYSWTPWSTKIHLSSDRVKPPKNEIT